MEQARFALGELLGSALLVWLVSFAIRKVRRTNLHLSYFLAVFLCVVLAVIVSPQPSEFAARYIIVGLLVWLIAGIRSWMTNRKRPQQPIDTTNR